MSGIIKKVMKHKKAFAALCLCIVFVAYLLIFRLYLLALLFVSIVMGNELTFKKMMEQKTPFDTRSKVRNADCIVIGDVGKKALKEVAGEGTVVSICLPGCTPAGAYEMLRHTFSILKESGGRAVLVINRKNLKKRKYSLFETYFYHPTAINRLGLKNINL